MLFHELRTGFCGRRIHNLDVHAKVEGLAILLHLCQEIRLDALINHVKVDNASLRSDVVPDSRSIIEVESLRFFTKRFEPVSKSTYGLRNG
jgi:hypothetical protein